MSPGAAFTEGTGKRHIVSLESSMLPIAITFHGGIHVNPFRQRQRGQSLVPTREETGLSGQGVIWLDEVGSSVHHKIHRNIDSHGRHPLCRYQPNKMLLGLVGSWAGGVLLSSRSQGARSHAIEASVRPMILWFALQFWGKGRSKVLISD